MIGKLFTFSSKNRNGVGFEYDGRQYDLNTTLWHCGSDLGIDIPEKLSMLEMITLVNKNPEILDTLLNTITEQHLEAACVLPETWKFEMPLQPPKIVAVGWNYAAHAKEGGYEVPESPVLFAKMTSSMIAHKETIRIPEGVGRVDYEIELGVIISDKVSGVSADEAQNYIAGYTIFNDVTARDLQRQHKTTGRPWTVAKGYDTFGPCGPYVIPACMLPDPHNLELILTLNGEVKQHGYTRDMVFTIYELIAYISSIFTLFPGDIIATGTPEGISPLKSGDVIVAEIQPIGKLENPVQ
ncbi:fumarylacetoacetate hydrolase family protein [candidate division KSB1 bacterium]